MNGTITANLTQGSILFAGASGLVAQDNSNLFWDDTNDRLGIGITPSYDFHLQKDVEGTVVSRIYNTNALGITEHVVGATGGGHIALIANSHTDSHYDIPGGSAGITVPWGNKLTLSVGDNDSAAKMMEFNAATDIIRMFAELNVPEVYNSSGDLKIQPDVQGNVELFGDTDVGNGDDGKMLYVRRRASEGNEYMRLYITSGQKGMIHTSADMTLQGQATFIINSVTDDIMFKVGDSAGAKKVYFRDSTGTDVATIDSNGNAWFDGTLAVGIGTPDYTAHIAEQDSDAVMTLERLGDIVGMGYGVGGVYFKGGETTPSDVGIIRVIATEDWTATSSPTKMTFGTTPPGSLSFSHHMILDDYGNLDVSGILDAKSAALSDTVLFSDGSTQSNASNPFTWHIGNARHKQSKDLSIQTDGPSGVFFKPDGTKFYIVDNQLDKVFEYDLSTAWDVTSATYNSANFTTTGSTNPQGIYFRSDGLKMYLADAGDDEINEYNLDPAWDITSAYWHQLKSLPSSTPNGIFFRPDGRRMYVSDGTNENVGQYVLTVAWDVTTATWDANFGTSIDNVEDVSFSSDGLKMYIVDGSAEDDIHEFELTIAWDIKTASLSALYHINEDSIPNGVTFKPDGTKMYVIGNSTDSIYEYDLGLVFPNPVAIGHGGAPYPLPLDVRSEDNIQIVAHDSSAQTVGVGGGIIFGGHYTDADDVAIGGRIGVEKLNSTSGSFGFDMIFQSMPDGGSLTEILRLSADANNILVSSGLEVQTTTGALVIPRMTTTQRNALTAVNGMMVYNTSTNAFNKRENGAWASF